MINARISGFKCSNVVCSMKQNTKAALVIKVE